MTTPTDFATAATRAVLSRYEHELYEARDLSLVAELLAEPMYRHYAGGKVTAMTNDDCRARMGGFFDDYAVLTFRTVHLVVEGPLASWTYELTATANDGRVTQISSIETFELKDGKIAHVWNAEYTDGPWV
jgi:hypothetical protein